VKGFGLEQKMRVIKSAKKMQAVSMALKRQGKTIGFVPTMGYLHQGHLSLVRRARKISDIVVVSIFVNPAQFGPKEDLNRYPRDLKGDLAQLKPLGVDYVFFPSVKDMYPEGYQTFVEVEKLSQGLCGDFRPGHFRGVATVVAKLFNIVHPDVAVFGEKDYQQLKVIEQMTKDLNFRIKIIGAKTIREKDGLAMSSRNSYLSKEEREQARALSQALFLAREQVKAGERHADKLIQTARRMLEKIPKLRIEYIEIRDSEKLEPVKIIDKPCQMLMAVWIGKTRLIDNLRICPQNKRKG